MPTINGKSIISEELERQLREKGIDLVRFSRDLALKSAQHADTPSGKKGEEFVLTQSIIDELIASQEAMMKREAPQRFIRNTRVLEANQRHADIREKAQKAHKEAHAKAQSYSGNFDTLDPSEQEKVLATLKNAWGQSAIGMTPVHQTLSEISDIVTRLEEHAKGKTYVQEIIKNIATKFSEQEEKVFAEEISITEYVANCKAILAEHASELSKPQTIVEFTRDFILNSLRAIFSVLDKLYTWAMSKEKTLAEETGRKAYIPAPRTALAIELETIQSEFPHVESELTKSLEAVAARNERDAERQQRCEAAAEGAHPKQSEISDNISGFFARKEAQRQRELEKRSAAMSDEETPAQKQAREKADKWMARQEMRRQNLEDLVTAVVEERLKDRSVFFNSARVPREPESMVSQAAAATATV